MRTHKKQDPNVFGELPYPRQLIGSSRQASDHAFHKKHGITPHGGLEIPGSITVGVYSSGYGIYNIWYMEIYCIWYQLMCELMIS